MENQSYSMETTTLGLTDEEFGFNFVAFMIKSLYAFIGITGIVGNGLVSAMLIKIPALRNTTNLLIGHQSVTDFISSCLLLATFLPPPVQVTAELVSRSTIVALLICKFWVSRLLFWVTIKASTVNLVCITLERYVAVVHPLKYRERLRPAEASVICGIIWFTGGMIQAYQLPTWFLEDGACILQFRHRALAVISGVWVFAMTLVVPRVVMTCVYASIFRASQRKIAPVSVVNEQTAAGTRASASKVEGGVELKGVSTRQSCAQQSSNDPGKADTYTTNNKNEKREKVRRNVLSTLIIVSVTYAICWTPNQIYFFYFNLGGKVDFNSGIYFFTVLASAANMCMNPIIYAFKYKKVQIGMRRMIFGKQFRGF